MQVMTNYKTKPIGISQASQSFVRAASPYTAATRFSGATPGKVTQVVRRLWSDAKQAKHNAQETWQDIRSIASGAWGVAKRYPKVSSIIAGFFLLPLAVSPILYVLDKPASKRTPVKVQPAQRQQTVPKVGPKASPKNGKNEQTNPVASPTVKSSPSPSPSPTAKAVESKPGEKSKEE